MKAIADLTSRLQDHLGSGNPVWFFLDYDGTLADFAPTPEIVEPDPELIHILRRLSQQVGIRLTLISGRMLSQVRILVPLDHIYVAGTYGVEVLLPGGEVIQRVDLDAIRPVLLHVKSGWGGLVQGLEGFFIEDKNWAVALHAKFAEGNTADRVLAQADEIARQEMQGEGLQLLGGHRFLEISPTLAHKGKTVAWLLDKFPLREALLVYLGDDDKDEQAYAVIHASGGACVLVGRPRGESQADYNLEGPADVRSWLMNWANS
jgi:trehalose 6-phosphate phosphatase